MTIGRSTMRWERDRLVVDIDERTAPLGRPLRGRITLLPEARTEAALDIASDGAHRWWPVAPSGRIEVDLPQPGVRFAGHGYHDANAGASPLHAAFDTWDWSRARTPDGGLITYDVRGIGAVPSAHALRISRHGDVEPLESTWTTPLPPTAWRLEPTARVDDGHTARRVRSLEDGPFYARSLIETRLGGHHVVAVHESLAAQRLRKPWVRSLTWWRMRRA